MKIQQNVLLGRINGEIKENHLIMTISDLSEELRQNINDTIPPEITKQGLKATHCFLLEFIPSQYKQYFQYPKRK